MIQGIPFSMSLPKQEYKAEQAVRAMQEISAQAQANGVADLTLEEINAEIQAVRNKNRRLEGNKTWPSMLYLIQMYWYLLSSAGIPILVLS